jgi:hypothetical protein
MWMLSFVPDSILQLVVYCLMAGGLGLYTAGLLANFIPPLRLYKEPIRIIGTAVAVAGVYFFGAYSTEMEWRDRVKEVQAKLEVAEAKSKEVVTVVKEKIVWKTKVIHDTQVVVQEKIVRDAAVIDAQCKVPPIAIEDLNAAAQDPTKNSAEVKK